MREGTPLQRARAALALTAVPASMPCREEERARILQFVEKALTGAPRHGCLKVLVAHDTHKHMEGTQIAMNSLREGAKGRSCCCCCSWY